MNWGAGAFPELEYLSVGELGESWSVGGRELERGSAGALER
jgi:hypothetical protein